MEQERIKCLICLKSFKAVGVHVFQRHRILSRDYRIMFDLPLNHGLQTLEVVEKKRAAVVENWDINMVNLKRGAKTRYKPGDARGAIPGGALGWKSCGKTVPEPDGFAAWERKPHPPRHPRRWPKRCALCGVEFLSTFKATARPLYCKKAHALRAWYQNNPDKRAEMLKRAREKAQARRDAAKAGTVQTDALQFGYADKKI